MRKALQSLLTTLAAFLDKPEPARPCTCITDIDDIHSTDCKVGPRRDERQRYEESRWVLERILDLEESYTSRVHLNALMDLRKQIEERWRNK